ncbi:hypothetical protein HYV12_00480 [Candidatus Dojkabacteria bacterium]|nr:hypothetical protein [Candidatus Dojkabacteria bacterium]
MYSEEEKKSEKLVTHFEDVSLSDVSENLSGRKGLSLFKLHNFDSPVPDFFVISPAVFFQFSSKVFREKKKEIESMKETLENRDVANMFSRFDLEQDVTTDIIKNYTKLSGFTDAWVSVRSSVSFPKRPEVSFSGLFDTQLNVRGVENLLKSIKQVYASVFTDSVVKYCVNENIDLSEVGLAIVVQKMVQPEVSGVVFTIDPITQDQTRMSVEAVYGLGDVISNGDITPDSYVLLKKDLAIVEKHIAPQEWMKVRTLKSGGVNTSEKIQISPAWSHRQKLEDKYIVEISKVGMRLEDQMGEALDIEWVLSGGRLWILQAKNTFASQSIVSNVQFGYGSFVADTLFKVVKEIISRFDDSAELEKQAVQEAGRYMEKEFEKVRKVEEVKVDMSPAPVPPKAKISIDGEQFMFSGIGSSFGITQGTVKMYAGEDVPVTKDVILVMKRYEKEMYEVVSKAGGVILDTGGLTSDISIVCRELNIPAVVGSIVGTTMLSSGDIIKMDGNSGSVYLVDKAKGEQQAVADGITEKLNHIVEMPVAPVIEEVPVSDNVTNAYVHERDLNLPHTATKIFTSLSNLDEVVNSDGVMYLSLDQLMIEDGRHPLAYVADKKYKEYADSIAKKIDAVASVASPNEVVLSIGEHTIKSFKALVKGKEFEESSLPEKTMGTSRYLDNAKLLDLVLRIVKRTRNVLHNRNVSLAVHSPINGSVMREIKKSISASGLRRTSTFNIYAIIENPSEVIVLDDIANTDIDGLILNTPAIAKQMQGIDYEDSTTKYDLAVGSVYTVIDSVVATSRKNRLKLSVVTNSNTDIIKYCVSKGVYGISVTESIADAKKLVSQQETKILLGGK